eukprot:TRINITY_DN4159_c0_g1_i1.p1 TRINITY_DN4159_c0_g1~~TRINITY_DN4159_c0_g1_i1.p1  ORF type:complete len:963 (-),score=390.78 TRINITY_DN4159_c0_g1_i1:111-2999(-)
MSDKGKKGSQPGGNKPKGKQEASPQVEKNQEKKPQPKQEDIKVEKPVEKQAAQPNASPAVEKKPPREPRAQPAKDSGAGIVKSVLSGDTIVVINIQKNQAPTEKIISLSNLSAPLLGRKKANESKASVDEPFAWQSRDYLRQKLIGKSVTYTIEAKTPNKEYGIVFLDNVNVAEDLIRNGWVKLRRTEGKELFSELRELGEMEEKAEKEGKGIWSKNKPANAVRPQQNSDKSPTDLIQKLKGAAQVGIIEQVKAGNKFRITLIPSFLEVTVLLSGVDCPTSDPSKNEPFGKEAKFFSEHHLLNREVQIIFEGADKNFLYATISYNGRFISEELLKEGLGRYVEWSAQRTSLNDKLKAAEGSAKQKKLRLWVNYAPAKPLSRQEEKKVAKPGREITGKVIEVLNAGAITIVDASNVEHKIFLSSVKVPRQGPQGKENKKDDKKEESKEAKEDALEKAISYEAKEYLRRKLIGNKIRCVLDYIRNVPIKDGSEERHYCSVYSDKNNVAVELVEQGFAKPQEHKGGEPRSRDYEHIIFAESRATKAAKGWYAAPGQGRAATNIVDVSRDAKLAKAKFPSLNRQDRIRGVVEYEFSASRFKILVPKENCEIILSIGVVQTPQRDSKLFAPALRFIKEKIHQHDVEFNVNAQDKGAGFIGNIWFGKVNLAVILLEEGYAKIYRSSEATNDLQDAEDTAKAQKKNLWADYDAEKEAADRQAKREAREGESKGKRSEFFDVLVTEIVDANKFYIQKLGPDSESLEQLMQNLSQDESHEAINEISKFPSELVKAQFTVDDAWYRAKVVGKKDDQYEVFYVDYGNSEVLPLARIQRLSSKFTELKPQAIEAALAYVKIPTDEDNALEAGEYLRELVWNKPVVAQIERENNGVLQLSLGDKESQVHVNGAIIRAGLGRVEKVRGGYNGELVNKLREEEKSARQSHLGIWEYGDPGSDEEDNSDKPKGFKKRN